MGYKMNGRVGVVFIIQFTKHLGGMGKIGVLQNLELTLLWIVCKMEKHSGYIGIQMSPAKNTLECAIRNS